MGEILEVDRLVYDIALTPNPILDQMNVLLGGEMVTVVLQNMAADNTGEVRRWSAISHQEVTAGALIQDMTQRSVLLLKNHVIMWKEDHGHIQNLIIQGTATDHLRDVQGAQ